MAIGEVGLVDRILDTPGSGLVVGFLSGSIAERLGVLFEFFVSLGVLCIVLRIVVRRRRRLEVPS